MIFHQSKKIHKVLFICYANICRSPAAEKLAESYATKYDLKDVKFDSAGWHTAYDTAVKETKDFVKSKGIDMTNFKSKQITPELLQAQDLIIGFETYHLVKIRNTFKELKNRLKDKMFTLKELNGANENEINIPDPFNTGVENYNRIMKVIDENVEMLVKKIKEINTKSDF